MTGTLIEPKLYDIQIRFNQEHEKTGLAWRLILDGQEHLVNTIKIRSEMQTEVFFKEGVLKGNVVTRGFPIIDSSRNVIIEPEVPVDYETQHQN
jgi:hypothetical protein